MTGNICSTLYKLLGFKICFYHLYLCLQFMADCDPGSSFLSCEYPLHQAIDKTLSFLECTW